MFDHEQTRLDDLQHKTKRRYRMRGAPDAQIGAVVPHAEMNAGALDDGRHLRQRAGLERQRTLEQQAARILLRWKICERDFRDVAFFATQARPEGRVDQPLDHARIGQRRERLDAAAARRVEVPHKMRVNFRGNDARRRKTVSARCGVTRTIVGVRLCAPLKVKTSYLVAETQRRREILSKILCAFSATSRLCDEIVFSHRKVTRCALQFQTSPSTRFVSLRQSIAFTMPNSLAILPALPNLPTTWPFKRSL